MSRTQLGAGGTSAIAETPPFARSLEQVDLTPQPDAQSADLFELSPDLLAVAASEPPRWLRVNPAFYTLLGWSMDELVQRPLLDIVHVADHDRVQKVQDDLKTAVAANLEVRLLCKGGGCRWVAWHIALDRHAESLLLIGRDITQNRRTMKNLRSASVRMQRENESLEQFVRTAGHDLQEPLRTLRLHSDLLMRRYGAEMPAQSAELLSHIFGAATRMQTLVRDLLVFASISPETDHNRNGSSFVEVSLSKILDDVLQGLQSSIEESTATITYDVLPNVRGDETQLAQLLQNLISNSLKYRRPGVPAIIHIGVERRCGEWQFYVTDNGQGFDPKYQEGIFLDFKRLHGREIPGTGLGLPICRRIVNRHEGRIWAEGRPGSGATFWFTLPTRAA